MRRQSPYVLALVCGFLVQHMWGQVGFVPIPELPPWCTSSDNCSNELAIEVDGILVKGKAMVRMGHDGLFDKPILLVEGFDFGQGWHPQMNGFGTVTWNGIYGGDLTGFPEGLNYRPMLDDLYQKGGDVVLLDFADGTASVQQKTKLLDHLLHLVRDAQHGALPGILVGVSMGGVVARLALAQWEDLGQSHCIGEFFSVDAPHLGATLPTGLQALVLGLSDMSAQGQALWDAMNSIAARQLVAHHITSSQSHEDTQALLQNTGWPKACNNLAVVNSRPDAHAHLTNEPLLNIEWGLNLPIQSGVYFVRAGRWQQGGTDISASFALPSFNMADGNASLMDIGVLSFPQPEEDAASKPGSVSGHLSLLAQSLTSSLPLFVEHESVQNDVTFVSHTSALGQTSTESNEPWTDVSVASTDQPRETHASLPSHHRAWMLSWIEAMWNDHPDHVQAQEDSYTLGWQQPRKKFLLSSLIQQEGKIHIGNSSDPFKASSSACGQTTVIRNGGELHVGNHDGAKGDFAVVSSSNISAETDGRIEVHAGSTLTIHKHAMLHLAGGTVVVHPEAELILEPDAEMLFEQNGLLVVEEHGKLTLHGTMAVSAFEQGRIECRGHITWEAGANVWTGAEAKLHIRGLGNSHHLMFGLHNWWGNGKVMCEGGDWEFIDTAQLKAHADVQIKHMRILGGLHENTDLNTHGQVILHNCELGEFRWQHEGTPNSNSLVMVTKNRWVDGTCSIEHAKVRLDANAFDNSSVFLKHSGFPSKITANQWESHWFESTPALSIQSDEAAVWVEKNAWSGGVGLHIHKSNPRMACNEWQGCIDAVVLYGQCSPCFTADCGGGSNRWENNQHHFRLQESPLPYLSHSNNHLGADHDALATGTTFSPVENWTVIGASWNQMLTDNPWTNLLDTDVQRCGAGGCENVPWYAHGLAPQKACTDFRPNPVRPKSLHSSNLWNILGQQVHFESVSPTWSFEQDGLQ